MNYEDQLEGDERALESGIVAHANDLYEFVLRVSRSDVLPNIVNAARRLVAQCNTWQPQPVAAGELNL